MHCSANACSKRRSPCEGRPVYLQHILGCISRIEEYTATGRESRISQRVASSEETSVRSSTFTGLMRLRWSS